MTEALTATLTTTQGTVTVRLFPDHAPKTVRNFVELAEGGKEWTNPVTRVKSKDKLYDGTIFHRVITNFMIQGGDPQDRCGEALRRNHLSPGDTGLHDPGRGSARHGYWRPRLQVR